MNFSSVFVYIVFALLIVLSVVKTDQLVAPELKLVKSYQQQKEQLANQKFKHQLANSNAWSNKSNNHRQNNNDSDH